jgi:hypothetical protein
MCSHRVQLCALILRVALTAVEHAIPGSPHRHYAAHRKPTAGVGRSVLSYGRCSGRTGSIYLDATPVTAHSEKQDRSTDRPAEPETTPAYPPVRTQTRSHHSAEITVPHTLLRKIEARSSR